MKYAVMVWRLDGHKREQVALLDTYADAVVLMRAYGHCAIVWIESRDRA